MALPCIARELLIAAVGWLVNFLQARLDSGDICWGGGDNFGYEIRVTVVRQVVGSSCIVQGVGL